jgi:hypothetical protein
MRKSFANMRQGRRLGCHMILGKANAVIGQTAADESVVAQTPRNMPPHHGGRLTLWNKGSLNAAPSGLLSD